MSIDVIIMTWHLMISHFCVVIMTKIIFAFIYQSMIFLMRLKWASVNSCLSFFFRICIEEQIIVLEINVHFFPWH